MQKLAVNNFRGQRQSAFALIELVVVLIVLGVLAAIAVPRFIAMNTDARIAAVKTLAGAVNTAVINFHAMCKLDPHCDYTVYYQPSVVIGGVSYGAVYGWPNAGGNQAAATEIGGLVNYSGFTLVAPGGQIYDSTFTLDGSPAPAQCSVTYTTPYQLGASVVPPVVMKTNGC